MLIEAWQQLHGCSNWTTTVATVQTSRIVKQEIAWESICKIVWQDQDRVPHSAEFEVFEESPLYQLCEGDSIDIRFNPAKPDEFFLPGLLQSKLAKAWKSIICAAIFILALVLTAAGWLGPVILNEVSH